MKSNIKAKKRISHWTIKIQWDNGKEEFVEYIPNYVATSVDEFLNQLEDEQEQQQLGV